MDCSTPGFPVHHCLLKLAQTHIHQVGDAIQPPHPLSSPSRPALNLSQNQGLFQWVGSSHQVSKVLELQLQHQSFQWIFRISFRIDWFDLLSVQGTLKNLLQHHSSEASILRCSVFFMVQLLHPYITTVKTITLTRWNFVGYTAIYSLLVIYSSDYIDLWNRGRCFSGIPLLSLWSSECWQFDLWFCDNTSLMAESKEELKNLLMRVKEESEKAGLKLNI